MKKTITLLTTFALLFSSIITVSADATVIIDDYTMEFDNQELNEYSYNNMESYPEEFSLKNYDLSDDMEDDTLTSAVTYKSVTIEPESNIMIFNTNNRSMTIKTDGACQYITYDSNGDIKTVNEKSKGNSSISVAKNGKVLIANSGSNTLTVKCDERYFNEYTKGFGLLYIDYNVLAGESIKLTNTTNINAKITITSLPETYAFIRYKNMDTLLSGGKWKKGKSINVNKGETLVITNESKNQNMTIHYSMALLDRNGSTPAYEERKLSIGSKCTVRNNSSKTLKLYAQNFANKKFSNSIKSNSTKTLQASSFGVSVYIPYGFMSFE